MLTMSNETIVVKNTFAEKKGKEMERYVDRVNGQVTFKQYSLDVGKHILRKKVIDLNAVFYVKETSSKENDDGTLATFTTTYTALKNNSKHFQALQQLLNGASFFSLTAEEQHEAKKLISEIFVAEGSIESPQHVWWNIMFLFYGNHDDFRKEMGELSERVPPKKWVSKKRAALALIVNIDESYMNHAEG